MTWWHIAQHWTAIHIGCYPNIWNLFWSGFGSDLGEATIIGAIIAAYRHRVCGVKWCPWIGIHPVDGTHHRTCHIHSTLAKHRQLRLEHAQKFPEQHQFINGGS